MWDVPAWSTKGWQQAAGTCRDTQEAPASPRPERGQLQLQEGIKLRPSQARSSTQQFKPGNTHSRGLLFQGTAQLISNSDVGSNALLEGAELLSAPWFHGGERGQKRPKF